MKRDLIFLVGLPRSGHSLLGSIFQQNKEVEVTSHNFISPLFNQLVDYKLSEIFVSYPDHNSINNIIKNCIDLYYKDWKAKYIIQRTTLSPDIILRLREYYPDRKIKFIVLERDILEVLASLIKWSKKEPTAYLNQIEQLTNDFYKCKFMMSDEGFIKTEWNVISYLKEKENKNSLFINFYDLTKNPDKEINKIYHFLNIKSFKHDFNNLKDFKPNNISYNNFLLGKNLYKIDKKIKPVKKYASKVLEESIITAFKKGAL